GPQPFRQIVNPNRTGFRISIAQRVNDSVFQLADVPGPGGLAEQALDFRIHLRDGNLAQVGIFLYQVPGQRENVPGTVAQRRHFNREDFKTAQKVFAKEAGRHHTLKIAMGGRDDSNVRAEDLVAAKAHELLLLQDVSADGFGEPASRASYISYSPVQTTNSDGFRIWTRLN